MANIAYVRVSTEEQNEARQVEALKAYDLKKTFKEKVSGKNTNRPQLEAMLDYAREGDTIYVHDLSRLARNTKDLLTLTETLEASKIGLVSLKENIDTSTPTGKLMLTMLGAIAEFERANLLERQREGIAIAKAQGKYAGRKEVEKPKEWEAIYQKWLTRQITAAEAMNQLGLKRNTFYKFIAQEKEKNSGDEV